MAHDRLGAPVTNVFPSSILPYNAPSFTTFDAPTEVSDPRPAPNETYVLVRSTGPVDASECEEPGVEAVEVTVLWGSSVLEVFHLSPPRAFFVGHGDGVDFLLPPELAPRERTAIVEIEQGVARVVQPDGATLSLRDDPSAVGLAAAGDRELRAGRRFDLEFGALTFRLATVTRGRRVPRAIGDYRGIGASLVCSFGAAAAFLGILAYYTPALGAMLDGELDRDQAARLRPYLTALAEREEKRKEAEGEKSAAPGGGTPGEEAKGPRGAMGRPNTPQTNKRTAVAGTGERVLSREQALTEARNFGLIGFLNAMNSRALPTAVWGADIANGPDQSDAWGALYGEDIGESGGQGGLDLSGIGSGGGARGDWIGLGTGGVCNPHCGVGTGGEGIGRGIGRGPGSGHVSTGPKLRAMGDTVTGGHLAPELIQRVVRQNFGRFRNCYESGLRTNPNLTGRVTTRFIIDRDGAVSTASNGGSDLPDSKVVGCVVSAFYGVSFPAPQNGVVRVNYPILFTPG